MTAALPRPRPCASCPYRRDVPSGLWATEEYDKLPRYDGDIIDQSQADAFAPFFCHQEVGGHVCSGWLAHRDPTDLLAVRLGISDDRLDPSCADYTTEVPLWSDGEQARTHGVRDIEAPSADAQQAIDKLLRTREVRRG